jgi:hypothetical protein
LEAKNDPLIRRAEIVLVDTALLHKARQRFRAQVEQQIKRMTQIETEFAPLLLHSYGELREVRALLAREESQFPMRRGPAV